MSPGWNKPNFLAWDNTTLPEAKVREQYRWNDISVHSMSVYICLSVRLYISMYICLSVCLSVCLYIYMYVCMSICLSSVYLFAIVYLHVRLCICVSKCLYMSARLTEFHPSLSIQICTRLQLVITRPSRRSFEIRSSYIKINVFVRGRDFKVSQTSNKSKISIYQTRGVHVIR